jgi:hypothetical protein
MLEIPSIRKPRLRLLGVRATLKRVAEKPELTMHGLRERDSMRRSAETRGAAAAARVLFSERVGANASGWWWWW